MRAWIIRSAMLTAAEMSAKPTKQVRNIRGGIYGGTIWEIDREFEKCSAPNTASGTEKKIGPNTITFSSPSAAEKDLLAHLRHFAIQSRHNLLIPHSAESFYAET
jgi:hypothetical protein